MRFIMISLLGVSLLTGLTGVNALANTKAEQAQLAEACKEKKPGETVVVNGKEMKCPLSIGGKKPTNKYNWDVNKQKKY